jgi:hypothetical protein
LQDVEFKCGGLINLAGEISSHHDIQAMAWILLLLLPRYIMRIGKNLKNLQFFRKEHI